MDTTKQLFVRASKSSVPLKRVISVYRRFYTRSEEGNIYAHIANILLDICKEYDLIDITKLVNELNPSKDYIYCQDDDELDFNYSCNNYHYKCTKILISIIRLSKVDKFDGLTAPIMFRRKIKSPMC